MVLPVLVVFGIKKLVVWTVAHASTSTVTDADLQVAEHVISQVAARNYVGAIATSHYAYKFGSEAWEERKCKTKSCEGANLSIGDICAYCRKRKQF